MRAHFDSVEVAGLHCFIWDAMCCGVNCFDGRDWLVVAKILRCLAKDSAFACVLLRTAPSFVSAAEGATCFNTLVSV